MVNRFKTFLLLACFPLLTIASFWLTLAALIAIASLILWMLQTRIAFALPFSLADMVPPALWPALHITSPPLRPVYALPAPPDILWHNYAWLVTEATIAASPYLLGIALLWLIFGFLYEERLVRYLANARGIARSECPPLFEALEEVCTKVSMPMPQLYLARELPVNAFASGLGPKSYSITVTAGLIGTLDAAEVRAVLAHELSHIKNGDVRLLTIGNIITGIIAWLPNTLWRYVVHSLMGYNTRYNRLLFSIPFVIILASVLSIGAALGSFVKLILMREREMLADKGAATITNDAPAMASALYRIAQRPEQWLLPPALQDSVLYRKPKQGWWRNSWSTHPPLAKRLAALDELDARKHLAAAPLVKVIVKNHN